MADRGRSEDDIRAAADAYRKQKEWEAMQPPGPLFHLRQTHVMRGEGDGVTVYFGRHRGAGFVGIDLRGFNGWRSGPRCFGGYEFFNPTLSVGRLFMQGHHRSWSREVLVPEKLWSFWSWKVRPSGRRFMREHGRPEPMEAES